MRLMAGSWRLLVIVGLPGGVALFVSAGRDV